MKENIVVSACLLGENCKYNGKNNYTEVVEKLKNKYNIIPICPEVMGGLSTPRHPSEIQQESGFVFNSMGEDITAEFNIGAEKALEITKKNNCKKAVLKSNSPSCGYGKIYDGKFSGNLIEGNGVTGELFSKNGIEILNEHNI